MANTPISVDLSHPMPRGFIETTPCAYGFVDGPEPPDASEGAWAVLAQRPFRAHYLWAWGEPGALLTSITLHEDEQLAVMPVPLESFERLAVSPSHFHRLVLPGAGCRVIEPAQRHDGGRSALLQLEGAQLDPAIDVLNHIRPRLTFPSIPAGAAIHLEFTGRVRGLVLVGEQVP